MFCIASSGFRGHSGSLGGFVVENLTFARGIVYPLEWTRR